MPLRILTVCTGNICRSPLVEQLLRAQLPPLEFDVASAGTHALSGAPMTDSALEMARRLELRYADEHRASRLAEGDVRRADLVLGLDRGHRRQIVELAPSASRRTMTLREFAAIIAVLPDRGAASRQASEDYEVDYTGALNHALKHRGLQPRPADPRELDVVDPYGQAFSVYEKSTATIVSAVATITDYLNSVADSEMRG